MEKKEYDLVCVGGGIMSGTLALICKILNPEMSILILERQSEVAQESSATWNNAGTGHSALCELNYTPEDENGKIDISKAVKICNQFEVSKQFWSYLVNQNFIKDPSSFINHVPHHSWVVGKDNVNYLEKRYQAMKSHFMFDSIEFTKEIEVMKKWFPLIMHNRSSDELMAATRIDRGTEMNFGTLTQHLFSILENEFDTKVLCNKEVQDVDPSSDHDWDLEIKDLKTSKTDYIEAKKVFIGAGGGSLLLLEKVEIKEKDGTITSSPFPIS